MGLIEQRHPKLGQLMRLWRSRRRREGAPLASALLDEALGELAASTVLLACTNADAPRLMIEASGAEVDALYGEPLTGAPVERLAPMRDVEAEAYSAIETGRPVVVEDDVVIGDARRRIARLYLPVAKGDGGADGVLCGIVAVH